MESNIDKATFQHMLSSSLESATLTDKGLTRKIEQINQELASQTSLKGVEYILALDRKIAEYVYSTYTSVALTEDEKVVGIKGQERTELFDATDCKPHFDL